MKVDFTNCDVNQYKMYGGVNGQKIAIDYNGELYMLKFPPPIFDDPTLLTYSNNCICEHIGSSIFNMLNVKAQDTILGTFTFKNGKTKIVCACKDFTADGKEFFDFCSLKNSIITSETAGRNTELSDILDCIEKQKVVDPDELTERFWNMFVIDALLCNFDRHNGNWGFLYDREKDSMEIAPVYDCGSCLSSQADDERMKLMLDNQVKMDFRIRDLSTSSIKVNNNRINYYDFITSGQNEDCLKAVKRIYQDIDLLKINQFIDNISYITDLQKSFYKSFIIRSHELILEPAYQVAKEVINEQQWIP